MNRFTNLMFVVLFMLAGNTMNAQQQGRNCGTMSYYEEMLKQQPQFAKARAKSEVATQRILQQHPNFRATAGGNIVIPVVFHVIYRTAADNISDARIFDQLQVLNDDYARLNADSNNTPSVFASLATGTGIQFCLAQRDPDNNPTTGIERVLTTVTSWSTNDAVKSTATGGDDPWDRNSYLNVWVCNLGSGLLGYATFPGGSAALDGVVVLNQSVGGPNAPGTATGYDLGRTLTHEVGHWLNLYHNFQGGCTNTSCASQGDNVCDTPAETGPNFGCPTFPSITCSNGPNGDMFMNYMDYVDDNCMNMFTLGQSARMNAIFGLGGSRASLLLSQGCVPLVLQTTDAGIQAIVAPTGSLCSGSIIPVVTLRNFGINTLTSATINYQVDAGTINTYNWVGSLATNAAVDVTLSAVTVASGAHTLTAYTTNPNGVADQNATNDSQTGNFSAAAAGSATPYAQGFEVGGFPPTGWTAFNPDAATTWLQTSLAAYTGTKSMWIENANYNSTGEVDEMSMQPVDLSTLTNPEFTFRLAYKLWTDPTSVPNFSDTLEVLVSTDCGVTYTSIYKKFGVTLTTTTPTWQNSDFIPTATQWRKESINLAAYASATSAIFKFRNTTDYENNMYIDDINIDEVLGVNEIKSDPSFSVFPIPSKGMINVQWTSLVKEDLTVTVTNSVGEIIYSTEVKNYNGELLKVDMSKKAKGVYFVKVQSSTKVINQKIVLNN